MRHYVELEQILEKKGLLKKNMFYEVFRILFIWILLAISIALLLLYDNVWVLVLNAIFMGFVSGQLGFVAHDSGHHQMSKKTKTNDLICMFHANLFVGISYAWWMHKHNEHHSSPKIEERDPDINIKFIAFTKEQALEKKGFAKFITKHQAKLFFFLLTFEGYNLRAASIKYVIQKKKFMEFLLMAMHYYLYLSLIFYALDGWSILLFIAIHQAVFGLYMGSVFAPNHKGMPTFKEKDRPDFVRLQVLTARNIKPHPLVDFFYGGLNYQIEHHLFPDLSRKNLRKAQKVIKKFCKENSIDYYETSWISSFSEIIRGLHEASEPLRK